MAGRRNATSRARDTAVRLDSLTGLRAFAAFAVFLRHVQGLYNETPAETFLERLGVQGFTGVSFFFVLSGFVLTWSHRDGDSPRAFYRRRFARIAPAYWLALVVATALTVVVESERGWRPVLEAAPSVLAVQAWVPEPRIYFGGNGPGWSISCEVFFYALFPLLISVRRRWLRRPLATTAVLVVAASAWPLLLHAPDSPSVASWATLHLPLVRLAEFALGIALAEAIQRGWRPRAPWSLAVCVSVGGYLAAGWLPTYAAPLLTVGPFALLIASAAARDLEGAGTVASRPSMRRLGEWSFAFYLVHEPVLRVLIPVIRRIGDGLTLVTAAGALALALAVGLAALLYRWIEAPLERRLRRAAPRPEMTAAAHGGTDPDHPAATTPPTA
ncbi:acyltransferase family protein [Geodermatophilus sp. SYSU D01119]